MKRIVERRLGKTVNKVRAEVDSDAEVIIGSITDSSLDGKMRVSIVATSLDGISPEEKSVVSMVHRLQNRNSGYQNPAINPNVAQVASNEGNLNSAPIYGANALKMDHDLDKESVPAERNNADMGTQDNKLDTGTEDNKLNEISLDSLAYIENAEQNNQEENQQQTDITQSVNQGEKEETTPQLFTEEEDADASKESRPDQTHRPVPIMAIVVATRPTCRIFPQNTPRYGMLSER